jgi:two-component system cell cycle response regulator CpdR
MGGKKSRTNPASRVNLLNLWRYGRFLDEGVTGRNRHAAVYLGTDFRMIRILLAEDDDVMREYLARALTGAGYHVTAVDRGTEAVPYIDSGTFDLLLSDIVMPEMDGIELAQHTAKVAPQTQVMFITGFAAVSLRAEENVPQAKLLSKPFHLKDLVREVDNLFGRADRSSQQ